MQLDLGLILVLDPAWCIRESFIAIFKCAFPPNAVRLDAGLFGGPFDHEWGKAVCSRLVISIFAQCIILDPMTPPDPN
jgi:hypothetical protein